MEDKGKMLRAKAKKASNAKWLFRLTSKNKRLCAQVKSGQIKSGYSQYDFHGATVFKPWGFEYLFYDAEDKGSCGWMLHIENGKGTSMHCHAKKSTIVHVVSGLLHLRTLANSKICVPGTMIVIEKGVFHAMAALADDTRVIELESPSEKTDAIRLFDPRWNREFMPYEHGCLVVRTTVSSRRHRPQRKKCR
jgi:quercetin dioxygenase-like cupin family protein